MSEPTIVYPCIKCGEEHDPDTTGCNPKGLLDTALMALEDEEARTIRCPHCCGVLGYRWQPRANG